MRDSLGFCIYTSSKYSMDGQWLHFPGDRILQLVQDEANRLANTQDHWPRLDFVGNSARPIRLRTFDEWSKTWRTIRNDRTIRDEHSYFNVAGRIIQRLARGGKPGGFADGFYVRDVRYSGTVREPVWDKRDGASYIDFATFFFKHGGHEIEASEAIATTLRSILTGTPDCSGKPAASLEAALPLLASAMFIAEPARNPRAHIIGLMMLDMVGRIYNSNYGEMKFYTVSKLFAHPDRLRQRAAQWNIRGAVPGAGKTTDQKGPTVTGSGPARRVTAAFATATSDVVYVEGKYSASPALSGRAGATVNLAHDYIQKKELTLAARWLAMQLNRNQTGLRDLIFHARNIGAADNSLNVMTATLDAEASEAKDRAWTEIQRLVQQRATTFAKM